MIKIYKIEHKGNIIIGMKFPYDKALMSSLKSIDTIKYSKTHQMWYLPYETMSWQSFLKLKIAYTIENIGTTDHAPSLSDNADKTIAVPPEECTTQAADTTSISIRYMHPYFYIRNVNQQQVNALKDIPKTYWNARYQNWVALANSEVLDVFYRQFKVITEDTFNSWKTQIRSVENPSTCTLYSSPEYPDKILIQLTGSNVDIDFLKQVPERTYDKSSKFWIVPGDEAILQRIQEHYISKNTIIVNRLKPVTIPSKKMTYGELAKYLLEKTDNEFMYSCQPYMDTLIKLRYSHNTIEEYYSKFSNFVKTILPLKCNEISEKEVNAFLIAISKETKSDGTLNSYINAVKFYYTRVCYLPDFKIDRIERPKKGLSLPKILSIQQIDSILRATKNLKHITILFGFYGHGVRLNELLSLRLEDLWWDRNQLFIFKGKGDKDRVIPMSSEFKEVAKLYIHEYKPKYWLFEWKDKENQYTDRSVQEVVRKAAKRAGINKKVTPHMFRHSYATHLVDSGTQLPFIKELLGHSNIKTTMIYTHVTTASVQQVVSPLDKLRNKK